MHPNTIFNFLIAGLIALVGLIYHALEKRIKELENYRQETIDRLARIESKFNHFDV